MTNRRYYVGQTWPVENRRAGLTGPAVENPCWFVLTVKTGQMEKAKAFLQDNGVAAWYPVRTRWRRNPFKPRERTKVVKPRFAGYVFARFTGVVYWDKLFEHEPARHMFRSVVTAAGLPASITDSAMDRFGVDWQDAEPDDPDKPPPVEFEAGQRVQITSGVLEGWTTEVTGVEADMVFVLLPMLQASAVSVSRDQLTLLEGLQA